MNRIDEIVTFNRLSRSHMDQIVDVQMKDVEKILKEKGVLLEIDERARIWLADHGYDPSYGARPLRRLIQKDVLNELSTMLLSGKLREGELLRMQVNTKGDIEFVKVHDVAATPAGQQAIEIKQ